MRNSIIRFGALYVFTVAVLLVIGLTLGSVRVGLHALWAGVVLTLAALFVKPVLRSLFRNAADRRGRGGQKAVQYALVYAVELALWLLTVWLTPVRASGFWGILLPPLILLLGWVVYDRIDDRLHTQVGRVYDAAEAKLRGAPAPTRTAAPSGSPATGPSTGHRSEPDDGLTPEQRRMLDELG
ncbi:hypothetical protein [Microbacterium sp.]|uniref:hypothetical protein n=1 Tax=Microbacterium sp. TaxID=51671 RepID=UPI002811B7A9|nr:hypothetical protein [Microbacterium sp.]